MCAHVNACVCVVQSFAFAFGSQQIALLVRQSNLTVHPGEGEPHLHRALGMALRGGQCQDGGVCSLVYNTGT